MNIATQKRARVFFDGQNLFRCAMSAFGDGYCFPNYDPVKLANYVCSTNGWELDKVCFYTGVPNINDDALWHKFWANKLAAMQRHPKVKVFRRQLRARWKEVNCPNCAHLHLPPVKFLVEKGVDVRIAIDSITCALNSESEVIVFFSQDQDLSEAVKEIKFIAKQQDRHVDIVSAYPYNINPRDNRGINGSIWISISKNDYDKCLDPNDYRQLRG